MTISIGRFDARVSKGSHGQCDLRPGGVLLILALTASYIAILLLYPPLLRVAVLGTVFAVCLILWNPHPSSWLPVLPLMFLLGGSTISLGVFNPSLMTLGGFVFFAFYALDKLAWNSPVPVPGLPVKLVLAAFAVQLVSIAVSIHLLGQHPWNALREGSGLFLFMPLMIIVPDICNSRQRVRRLIRGLVLTLLAAGAFGVMEYFSITGFSRIDMLIGYVYRGRVTSFLGNANVFAGYLEMMIPVAFAMAFTEREWKWRVIALLAAVLGILSVLYTFSRGGLLFMAFGCGMVFFYRFRNKLWFPLLLGGVFLGLLIRNADLFERQMSFFLNPRRTFSEPTLLHRYITYSGYLDQISEAPVTGIGWGADEFYWGRSKIYTFWEVRHRQSTEVIENFGGLNSLVLNHMVKGGVISLVSLLLICAGLAVAFARAFRAEKGVTVVAVIAGIVALFGHQLVDNLLQWPQISSVFWLLAGLLCTYPVMRRSSVDT